MDGVDPKQVLKDLSINDEHYMDKFNLLSFLLSGLPYKDNQCVIDSTIVQWAREVGLNVIEDVDDDENIFWACSIE